MTPSHAEFKPSPTRYRGRFAPSPTGPLHFGSLVAAFGSFLRARSQRGQWLLRIEDIDTPRVVAGAAIRQMEALQRFGLHWDGEVVWQSRRQEAYQAALEKLAAAGLLFPCRCSRGELSGALHRGCIGARLDGPAALRLRVPDRDIGFIDLIRGAQRQNLAREVGDVVLRRVDGLIAYQLAVVVDDAAQGITHVVRGEDLADNTPRQILLQRALGLPTPHYLHTPLVLAPNGEKLSKQNGAAALDMDDPMKALCVAATTLNLPAADTTTVSQALAFWAQAWGNRWP